VRVTTETIGFGRRGLGVGTWDMIDKGGRCDNGWLLCRECRTAVSTVDSKWPHWCQSESLAAAILMMRLFGCSVWWRGSAR
jgi:hypothetical protein